MSVKYIYGQVVYRATCKICHKRRTCRIDNMNRYYTAEASGKSIPVCLTTCSRYQGEKESERRGA
jgi:hypothetical protein